MREKLRRIPWAFGAAVIDEAARLRGIEPHEVMHRGKLRKPAWTRFGIMWVMRQLRFRLVDIADLFGMTDHVSIIYGSGVATGLREEKPDFRQYTDDLLLFAMSIDTEQATEAA